MSIEATSPMRPNPVSPSINLLTYFSDLPDPRIDRTKRHKLIDIVGVAICAVICGADGWAAIEEYGQAKERWLRQFFELPHGIPSDDTFRRVFSALSPAHFRECFLDWVHALRSQTAGEVIALDGKTVRRSYDRGDNKAAIHLISAWASANHLVLGQLKTKDKSNEITAIPDLLHMLAIKGSLITIDAMGCQTAIAAQIIEQGADYVLALKGNQGSTHQQVVEFFTQFPGPKPPSTPPTDQETERLQPQAAPQLLDLAAQQAQVQKRAQQQHAWEHAAAGHETVDGEHGRLEIRRYWQVTDLSWLEARSHWKHLHSIGMVEAERHVGEQITIERRYYLSSLKADLPRFAEAVRGHWGIENSLHWVLDVTFREDECRIRKGAAPENFAVLRHMAVNVLNQDSSGKRSLKMKRYRAGWDDNYLAQLLLSESVR